jgi:hypothetical protein
LYRFFIFLEEEEAGKHSRKPAGRQGPDRSRAERAEKRRRMKRKEKERVCTRLMELLETGRAAPNPVRLSAAAQEILADTRACYKVKENSNSKRK